MAAFKEVEGSRGVGNKGTDLETWYNHTSIINESGRTVFEVGHYESSTEDPYYSAGVPTTLTPETVFDHAETLLADFDRRSVPGEGKEYIWSVDVNDQVAEEQAHRPISLGEF